MKVVFDEYFLIINTTSVRFKNKILFTNLGLGVFATMDFCKGDFPLGCQGKLNFTQEFSQQF